MNTDHDIRRAALLTMWQHRHQVDRETRALWRVYRLTLRPLRLWAD